MGFIRNVPGWERATRALLGICLLGAAALVPLAGWVLWAALAASTRARCAPATPWRIPFSA